MPNDKSVPWGDDRPWAPAPDQQDKSMPGPFNPPLAARMPMLHAPEGQMEREFEGVGRKVVSAFFSADEIAVGGNDPDYEIEGVLIVATGQTRLGQHLRLTLEVADA